MPIVSSRGTSARARTHTHIKSEFTVHLPPSSSTPHPLPGRPGIHTPTQHTHGHTELQAWTCKRPLNSGSVVPSQAGAHCGHRHGGDPQRRVRGLDTHPLTHTSLKRPLRRKQPRGSGTYARAPKPVRLDTRSGGRGIMDFIHRRLSLASHLYGYAGLSLYVHTCAHATPYCVSRLPHEPHETKSPSPKFTERQPDDHNHRPHHFARVDFRRAERSCWRHPPA